MARADSKAVGGLHANGFAFVPQDRRRAPVPQHGIGRVVELGSFGFSKARLGKVALVEWLFCDAAETRAKKYAEFVHRRQRMMRPATPNSSVSHALGNGPPFSALSNWRSANVVALMPAAGPGPSHSGEKI